MTSVGPSLLSRIRHFDNQQPRWHDNLSTVILNTTDFKFLQTNVHWFLITLCWNSSQLFLVSQETSCVHLDKDWYQHQHKYHREDRVCNLETFGYQRTLTRLFSNRKIFQYKSLSKWFYIWFNGSISNPNVAAMCWFFFHFFIRVQCKINQQRKNLKMLSPLGQNYYWWTQKMKKKKKNKKKTFTQDWGSNIIKFTCTLVVPSKNFDLKKPLDFYSSNKTSALVFPLSYKCRPQL